MAKQEESIFKKAYTDFDQRLDQELEEEKEERRKQLLLQAPDYKLLNQMLESGEYGTELTAKLKEGGFYFLRSGEEDNTEKFMSIYRKTLQGYPESREELLKQAGLFGCMAFKQGMPDFGRACGQAIISGIRVAGSENADANAKELDDAWLYLKNVADMAARTRNDGAFREIISSLWKYWNDRNVVVTPGLLAALSDMLFVAADRRHINALATSCSFSRNVLRHSTADRAMRQQFIVDWGGTAAQIAQRGWEEESRVLLKYLCLCLGSLRDIGLIKKAMADVSVHMQMQSKWDDFETAFRLYYPCQLFALIMLRWGMRRYRHVLQEEIVLEVEAAVRDSGLLNQVERKLELLEEKENALDLVRFVLRNARDTAAACARLLMKDEWEIYAAWQREWLSASAGNKKRQKRIRLFMQLAAEYWHSTQPSRSKKQWEFMAEVVNPTLLTEKHRDILKLVS
ncbi:MAG: hypothetical protein IKZ43_04050 [Acidaminococcaceae bacterium]|nr:hypothetical protein [Acidaminococcaceae bacterium]MBR5111659.1 hypothetical protein [Clostridia bacterium]